MITKIVKGPYTKNGVELVEVEKCLWKAVIEITAFKDGDVWRNLESGHPLDKSEIDFALECKAEAKKGAEAARKAREVLGYEPKDKQ